MIAAKKQWMEEKEQQVQEEVALAKAHWEKEEKEVWNLDQGISIFFFVLLLFIFRNRTVCAVILPLEVAIKDLSF